MSIEFACDSCGQRYRRGDADAGKKGRCKCGEILTVPDDGFADIVAVEPQAEEQPKTRECPFCAEKILQRANKCRFCGEFLDPTIREQLKREAASAERMQRLATSLEVEPESLRDALFDSVPTRRSLLQSPVSCLGCLSVFALGTVCLILLTVVLEAINSSPGQAHPTASRPSAAPISHDLTNQQKNSLWWEWERANNAITDAIGDRYDSKRSSESDVEFVDRLAREIRGPIAAKYGVSYGRGKQVFSEGEGARWRSQSPPN